MTYCARIANLADLDALVSFTILEANEAEGITRTCKRVREGIKTALENDSIAKYWVLEKDYSEVIGNVSVVKEWSDWNSGATAGKSAPVSLPFGSLYTKFIDLRYRASILNIII